MWPPFGFSHNKQRGWGDGWGQARLGMGPLQAGLLGSHTAGSTCHRDRHVHSTTRPLTPSPVATTQNPVYSGTVQPARGHKKGVGKPSTLPWGPQPDEAWLCGPAQGCGYGRRVHTAPPLLPVPHGLQTLSWGLVCQVHGAPLL